MNVNGGSKTSRFSMGFTSFSLKNFSTIRTDASKKGRGAVCLELPTVGEWILQGQPLHINVLEMKVVKLALLTCQRKNYSFPNRQYNSLVSSCEDLGGVGTKSKYLMELTKEIWKYLLHHGITITAEYLPGSMNMETYWYFKPSTSISENLSDETKTRDGSFCFSTVSLTSTVQCMKIGSIH